MTAGCNAWFSCTDGRGCDHEGRTLQRGACLLLAADLRPQREPILDDITAPGSFFSYQAGHLKGDNIFFYKRCHNTFHSSRSHSLRSGGLLAEHACGVLV